MIQIVPARQQDSRRRCVAAFPLANVNLVAQHNSRLARQGQSRKLKAEIAKSDFCFLLSPFLLFFFVGRTPQ